MLSKETSGELPIIFGISSRTLFLVSLNPLSFGFLDFLQIILYYDRSPLNVNLKETRKQYKHSGPVHKLKAGTCRTERILVEGCDDRSMANHTTQWVTEELLKLLNCHNVNPSMSPSHQQRVLYQSTVRWVFGEGVGENKE